MGLFELHRRLRGSGRCLSWSGLLLLTMAFVSQGCSVLDLGRKLPGVPTDPADRFRDRQGDMGVAVPVLVQRKPDLSKTLTLADCIGIALAHKPETRSTWLGIRAAAAALGKAKAAYLPGADFAAQAVVGDPLEPSNPKADGVSYLLQAGLSIHYLLFDGGGRGARVAAAKAGLAAAGFAHNAGLRNVVRTVEKAYYALLAAEQQERIARESLRQAEEHVALAEERRKNDLAIRLDVLQAKTAKAQAALTLVQAQSQVRVARGVLAHAMGLSPDKVIHVTDVPDSDPRQVLSSVRALLEEARKSRPELALAQAKVRQAKASVKAARAAWWPTVSLSAQGSVQLRRFSDQYTMWSVGLGVTFSLFDGFAREYGVRQARLEAERARVDRVALARDLELEVWRAYAAMQEAGDAIRAARVLVETAEASARTAEGQYREGAATIVALVDAQAARVQARLRLVQARLAWYAGLAELRWAVGRLGSSGAGQRASKAGKSQSKGESGRVRRTGR